MGMHTPGPWWVDASRYGTIYIEANAVIDKRLQQEICSVGPTESGREQQESNARLIASAPDLLEALKRAIPIMEAEAKRLFTESFDELDVCREAISKATGGAK